MAKSTCVKCGGSRFEMTENSPANSRYKFMFIQCSSCGGVVGVVDYYHLPSLLHQIQEKLGII